MVTRLMPRPSHNAALLLVLAAAIIALQVSFMTTASVPSVLTNLEHSLQHCGMANKEDMVGAD